MQPRVRASIRVEACPITYVGLHRVRSTSPHPKGGPNIGIMNSAIKSDDNVHHGQGKKLLRHGREQKRPSSMNEQRRVQMTLVPSFCTAPFGFTGLMGLMSLQANVLGAIASLLCEASNHLNSTCSSQTFIQLSSTNTVPPT